MGCDFNKRVYMLGEVAAYKLIKQYSCFENIPQVPASLEQGKNEITYDFNIDDEPDFNQFSDNNLTLILDTTVTEPEDSIKKKRTGPKKDGLYDLSSINYQRCREIMRPEPVEKCCESGYFIPSDNPKYANTQLRKTIVEQYGFGSYWTRFKYYADNPIVINPERIIHPTAYPNIEIIYDTDISLNI
jgi:5'-3' exonuclease